MDWNVPSELIDPAARNAVCQSLTCIQQPGRQIVRMRPVDQQPELLVFEAHQIDSDIDHPRPRRSSWGHGKGTCIHQARQQAINACAPKLDGDHPRTSIRCVAQRPGAGPKGIQESNCSRLVLRQGQTLRRPTPDNAKVMPSEMARPGKYVDPRCPQRIGPCRGLKVQRAQANHVHRPQDTGLHTRMRGPAAWGGAGQRGGQVVPNGIE